MIRFSAPGAYLLLVPQGRALISFLRNNGMFKTDRLVVHGSVLARTTSRAIATNFDVEIILVKELCTHIAIVVEKLRRRPAPLVWEVNHR